jgi:hypothetical protein
VAVEERDTIRCGCFEMVTVAPPGCAIDTGKRALCGVEVDDCGAPHEVRARHAATAMTPSGPASFALTFG